MILRIGFKFSIYIFIQNKRKNAKNAKNAIYEKNAKNAKNVKNVKKYFNCNNK